MNTHTADHKAKIRHLCSCLVLCLHLASGAVAAPCEHSLTDEHLLTLRKLIINQVKSGCSITYMFTQHQDLSDICYIKAAFPHILDLLNTHFTYENGSDNYDYTRKLKDLIYNIYFQKCIPPIDEEIEENPVKFARLYTSLPREGLQKTEEVFQMYKRLISKNDKPVNWTCEDEYANNIPESTTVLHTQTTGTPECQCSCTHSLNTYRRSTPTVSPISPYTQSGAYIFRKKNGGTPELIVNDGATNSTKNQTSTILPNLGVISELYTKAELFTEHVSVPIHAESIDLFTSPTPDLIDNSSDSSAAMGNELQSVTTAPIASSSELPTRIPPHTASSQPSEKINTLLISDKSPVLVLGKRSLDTREQRVQYNSVSKLLWTWITEPTGFRKNKQVKHLELTSGEARTLPAEHVEQGSHKHLQRLLQLAKSLSGNVFKINNERDCKDSRCQKRTEDELYQRDRDRVKRQVVGKEYQLIHSSMSTTFLIISACLLSLFITVLFYCKQQWWICKKKTGL